MGAAQEVRKIRWLKSQHLIFLGQKLFHHGQLSCGSTFKDQFFRFIVDGAIEGREIEFGGFHRIA